MITPVRQDDAFLYDVSRARERKTSHEMFVWWLGQSGFLLCHAGDCLLFDPYLSDSLTRKYALTDKPHVRMTARVVDPARLDFVQLVTTSHNHTDHLDADTLRPLLAAARAAKLVGATSNRAFIEQRLGESVAGRLVTVGIGERVRVGNFSLTAVPAAHEELAPEFVGFVAEVGPFRVYHSGDTVRFPGMAEHLRSLRIDLALLPINGSAPERRVAGNLNGDEAAQLAHDMGARWVIPCHYDMFAFNTASPESFVAACRRLGQPHVVLRAGERWTLEQV